MELTIELLNLKIMLQQRGKESKESWVCLLFHTECVALPELTANLALQRPSKTLGANP